MTIDWTLPVETTEDPPRPVRVLFDKDGRAQAVWLEDEDEFVGIKDRYGECEDFTLRNVAPPKPEPVRLDGWVVVRPSDDINFDFLLNTGICTSLEACYKTIAHFDWEGAVPVHIVWMSDGSPVPSEASGTRLEWVHIANIELTEERDHWKAKAEALQAEVERMTPVVDAAVECVRAGPVMLSGKFTDLIGAVRAYQSQQAPAEPVKECGTCRFYVGNKTYDGCAFVRSITTECKNTGFGKWEPRHD